MSYIVLGTAGHSVGGRVELGVEMRAGIRLSSSFAIILVLVVCAGCAGGNKAAEPTTAVTDESAVESPAVDDTYIDAFVEVAPTSANEKAVSDKAGTFYDAWVEYKRGINPDAKLPSLEVLGGNPPKFIGYKVDVYSGADADGNRGQFSLIVSGDQMNIAPKVGYRQPIDLSQQSTLDFFSTRTPLDTWDVDPHHKPESDAEKAAVQKVQDFVDTLPKELLFTRDRVRLGGYTLFWGTSPAAEAFVIMSVQPGDNPHYASTNYWPH